MRASLIRSCVSQYALSTSKRIIRQSIFSKSIPLCLVRMHSDQHSSSSSSFLSQERKELYVRRFDILYRQMLKEFQQCIERNNIGSIATILRECCHKFGDRHQEDRRKLMMLCTLGLNVLGNKGLCDDCMELFRLMESDSTMPKPDGVARKTLLTSLAAAGRVDDCLRFYHEFCEKRGSDVEMVWQEVVDWEDNWVDPVLKGFANRGLVDESLHFLEDARSNDASPDVTVVGWNAVLKALANSRRQSECVKLLEEMRESNRSGTAPAPDVVSWNTVLGTCSNDSKECSRIFNAMCNDPAAPNTVTYTIVLKIFGRHDKDEFMRVLRRLRNDTSVTIDHKLCDVVMRRLADSGDLDEVSDFLDSIPRNVKNYQKMAEAGLMNYMTALANCKRVDDAEEVFKRMLTNVRGFPFPRDVYTWGNFLKILERSGRVDACMSYFDMMFTRNSAPKPTVVVWNTVLSAVTKSGNFRKGIEFIDRMGKSESAPRADTRMYNTLISSLKDTNGPKKAQTALSMFLEMHSNPARPNPNLTTMNIVLNILIHERHVRGCLRLLDEIHVANKSLPLVQYNRILVLFSTTRHVDECLDLFSVMRAGVKAPKPDVFSWSVVLGALSHSGRLDVCLQLFEEMQTGVDAVKPNEVTFKSVLKGFLNHLDRAQECVQLFNRMRDTEECTSDPFTWHVVLRVLVNSGHVDKALKLFTELREKIPSPPDRVWDTILYALAENGRLQERDRMLQLRAQCNHG